MDAPRHYKEVSRGFWESFDSELPAIVPARGDDRMALRGVAPTISIRSACSMSSFMRRSSLLSAWRIVIEHLLHALIKILDILVGLV